MDPDITTISPVNKLHPRDDILATGSSRCTYRCISSQHHYLMLDPSSHNSWGCPCRSIFIWKPKTEDELTEERTKQKAKEYVYGSGSRKKTNGKHDNSSDDDSDGDSGRKSKKAKKTRFTCTTKGKGKSKVWYLVSFVKQQFWQEFSHLPALPKIHKKSFVPSWPLAKMQKTHSGLLEPMPPNRFLMLLDLVK